ncbi:hypothetical protein LPJ78_000529 [Coemansia sp. RSA 989]|nr:transcriptional regulator of RNA polII, SAGA, subunit-domain-containing protein [Coemansia mojavensis]KAJ1740366.1 hypothetical protein LPJ68_003849 [Coemansia sp. RSA 1086]KAJ1753052.1 hypothetical protein LPJ79_000692 [Coemansia sp. RSA 1821]KAJ1868032.1 hypothetical protein LPJ78_000529 [Coemansia sp. RSA 989]KAJ1875385.1 hypothetical protein LPJ55_000741 [Coemansia sp. RSA 990]KAJ2633863.1 hypothetical protein H4R22_000138 [Coemansia sp. RSA 1290]KAJ2651515.1 hypothetical protein IWW40
MSIAHANARTDERYQLTQLKEQLAEALGDDGPAYWAALRDFVHGKLNRQEFDFYAYLYLTGEKAALHNQFIIATIHNAQSGQGPPEGERSRGFEGRKKRKREEENDDSQQNRRSIKALLEDPKWRYVKELVKSLNKNERRAIKTLLKRPNMTPEEAQRAIRSLKPVVLPMPPAQLPQSYAMDIAKGITAPLVYDTKSTPDIESLSYRMVAIALEQGLAGGVTREGGELLLYALDCHLKNIVSNMLYKTRSNRTLGIPVQTALAGPAAGPAVPASAHGKHPATGGLRLRDRLYSSKTTLHLADLAFSLEISPSTTVEPPRCMERWGSLLANQVLAESSAAGDEDEPTAAMDEGDDEDSGDNQQRRKARRLRARYERWFGPYVTVQCGNSGAAD